MSLTAEHVVNRIEWVRGRILLGAVRKPAGKELKDRHYWLLVSRNDINWNLELPVIAVPVVSWRAGTFRYASDVEVLKKDSPTNAAILIQCGQIRVLDRAEIKPMDTMACSKSLLALVEDKIVEVLGLKRHWVRKIL